MSLDYEDDPRYMRALAVMKNLGFREDQEIAGILGRSVQKINEDWKYVQENKLDFDEDYQEFLKDSAHVSEHLDEIQKRMDTEPVAPEEWNGRVRKSLEIDRELGFPVDFMSHEFYREYEALKTAP